MKDYSILINTTDSFEDCWLPFFTLFEAYWPDYKGKIYLNTETKVFTYPGLDIISVQNNLATAEIRITWSECLIRALNSIDSEVILYMQEDYFLKDTVKNDIVEKYVSLMQKNETFKCIHLTDQAVKSHSKSSYENLDEVANKQPYRVSCQAALWRKAELLELLREREDAWEFEEFGSMRSAVMKHDYYVVNKEFVKLNHFEIIPYIFTGIVQGRWFEETVPLFERNGIEMDFSKRGFVKNAPKKAFVKRVKYRLNKIPKIIRNYFELKAIKTS